MKICLVAHNAYGVMCGGQAGHIGGVERQATLMSRWLTARGHDVSLVTWNEGVSSADEIIDGVRVIKLCRRDAGLPGLRFISPRWSSLVRALGRADAELYFHNCAEYVTGQVALWCRRRNRRFVFSVASDPECDPALPMLTTLRDRWLYRYGLRRADRVIVQTRYQQEKLASGFSLAACVLPMPCEGPKADAFRPPAPPIAAGARVLWVGRIAPVKRLELLLDVAERLPAVIFDVVGKPDAEPGYVTRVMDRARALRNVRVRGAVDPELMPEMYRSASILCCTSVYEGFPNTFLEAWSHGIPVVSTIDPDGLIASRHLGSTGGNADELATGIQRLVEAPDVWRRASADARLLFLEHFSAESAMPRFELMFAETIEGKRPSTRSRTHDPAGILGDDMGAPAKTRQR